MDASEELDTELAEIRKRKLQELMGQPTEPTGGPAPREPIDLTAGEIDGFLADHGTVLIDFWAPWCGPCRIIGPVLEEIAEEMAGQVVIGKVNVDQHQAAAQRFGVQGIPTMVVAKDGQVVDRIVGAVPKPALKKRLASIAGT